MSRNESSRALERIQESVSHLLMPPLETLQELFIERREASRAESNALEKRRAQIREDGYEAAARLMLPEADALQKFECSYFEKMVPFNGGQQ